MFAWGLNTKGQLGNGATNNSTSPSPVGALGSSWLARGGCTTRYTYDGAGKLIQATSSNGTQTILTSYTYDQSGNLISISAQKGQ
jgi:YD repeat-containing protein